MRRLAVKISGGMERIMDRMEQIQNLTEEMLDGLGRLVQYNSVKGQEEPGMPFGPGPAACLDEALKLAGEMGFSTKNMDHYCGYAEMGQGQEIIGIAAHLDIVPAGEGWETDPFVMTRKGERVYGRGVSDDKGAVIAALYAMKLVRESGIRLDKRVRLLMGCDEESGSGCMKYYGEHGEKISAGFTPDGYFPGIHGEKGGCHMEVFSKHTKILSINGGFVSNAVCNHCVTVVPASEVEEEALRKALDETPLKNVTVTRDGGVITIDAQGVAAHASTPLLGVNAAGYTMLALKEAGMKDDFVDFYCERIGVSCDGAGIGCKVEDDYGSLTLNNGIVQMKDGIITCTIDIRYPVTLTPDRLRELAAPYLEDERGRIVIGGMTEPLFYPKESSLVKNLHSAYAEITGDTESQPMVIGGGTYAKSIPGIIAFGCEFPDTDNHIHDVNESLSIRELQLQTAIYARALENLLG